MRIFACLMFLVAAISFAMEWMFVLKHGNVHAHLAKQGELLGMGCLSLGLAASVVSLKRSDGNQP